jgi:hypothetical protein
MTVRFPYIRSLLVGLAALAGAVASGCADPKSKTDLPDKAEILQVMVFTDPNVGGSDYFTEPLSGYAIAYESQFPVGGNILATSDYGVCFLFDSTPGSQGQPTTLCQRPDQVADCVCPDTVDGTHLLCAQSGALIGRCVDPDTSALPEAIHAQPAGASIRLVVGKLLDGTTLEHFACACQGSELAALDPANCGTGTAWSLDPKDCGVCSEGVVASDAVGRCLDTDTNNLPDITSLIQGVATITCTGTAGPCPTGWTGSGTTCAYVSAEGDGYFYPSGNQFQSSVAGLSGVGPAIVINPASSLPTSADCTIAISDTVKFKTGEGLSIAGTPKWHTEALSLSLTAPEDTIEIAANGTALVITVGANAPLKDASFTVSVTDTNSTTTFPDATNSSPDLSAGDAAEATFPAITLIDNHLYTINVTGTAHDAFGQLITLDADTELSVNTTAAIPMSSKR